MISSLPPQSSRPQTVPLHCRCWDTSSCFSHACASVPYPRLTSVLQYARLCRVGPSDKALWEHWSLKGRFHSKIKIHRKVVFLSTDIADNFYFDQKYSHIIWQHFRNLFWPIQCAVTHHPLCCNSPSACSNQLITARGWWVTAQRMVNYSTLDGSK